MSDIKLISSIQNPLVKKILLLKEKSRERKKTGLFVIEGQREIELALKGKYHIETVLFCPEIASIDAKHPLFKGLNPEFIHISPQVYGKMAHRETTEGILAIAQSKSHTLDSIDLKRKTPLILVAEAPEKPGNIGALLRTADAASIDTVLIANPKSDIYNPNIIRSSVGCVFTNTVGMGSSADIIKFLKQNKVSIYSAALTASKNYVECDFRGDYAIVVGTEETGLKNEWLEN